MAHPCTETRQTMYRSSISAYRFFAVRDTKNNVRKRKKKGRSLKKPKHVTCDMFAETTYMVSMPLRFARVVLPNVVKYSKFHWNRSGLLKPRGWKVCLFLYLG